MNEVFNYCRVYRLELGKDYWVSMWGKSVGICRLIQPTPKGYNLLNLETSKCVLKRHIYPYKKVTDVKLFLVSKFIQISEINKVKTV